jgi:WD40 repeat protein
MIPAVGVRSIAFAPDGRAIAAGSDSGTVELSPIDDAAPAGSIAVSRSAVQALAFVEDGRVLVTGDGDGAVQLWRVADGSLIVSLPGHLGAVRSLAVAPDSRILASASDDRTIRLWALPSGEPLQAVPAHRAADGAALQSLDGHTQAVRAVSLRGGEVLVSASADDTVQLWGVR